MAMAFCRLTASSCRTRLARFPPDTNLGDTKYNRFDRHQYGTGYEFDHTFNDNWQFKQNLMYFSDITDILQVYGAGLVTNADGTPTDYRTVDRDNFPFDENIHALEADSRLSGKFSAGGVTQNVLIGLDFRHYTDHAEFGFASAPPIDLFNPTYGVPITTPPLSYPYLQQIQRQIGLYGEDVIKLSQWVLTLGGREDNLQMSNFGTQTTDHKFTYHVGLNYLLPGGLAPYLSYATSFQPTSGANFNGTAFKPTAGNQVEAGLKFQPTSVPSGMHLFATLAAYDLTQNNVLTPDPAHTLFEVQTGQVEVKGLELETVMRVGAHWSFNAVDHDHEPRSHQLQWPGLGQADSGDAEEHGFGTGGLHRAIRRFHQPRCEPGFPLHRAQLWRCRQYAQGWRRDSFRLHRPLLYPGSLAHGSQPVEYAQQNICRAVLQPLRVLLRCQARCELHGYPAVLVGWRVIIHETQAVSPAGSVRANGGSPAGEHSRLDCPLR